MRERLRGRGLRTAALAPLALLAGMAVVGLGVLGLMGLDRVGAFGVSQVQVVGAKGATATAVREAALATVGSASMLSVDADHVATAVEELPQIRTAEVDRSFPGTLRVTVTRERAVALAPTGNGLVLVGASGTVLGRPTERTQLPVISSAPADIPGPGGVVTAPRVREQIALAALPSRAIRLRAIGFGDDGMVGLLAGGGQVRFGDGRDLPVKVKVARAVMRRADGAFAYIDVTVPTAPVLRTATGDPLTANAPALNPGALPPVGDLGDWVAGAAPAESIRTVFG
ncbi:MAG: FtsQ-type POTRA domain-containing protein [Actinobacteria bacterium]|nr:FtsQ-type POTRA domain-containing protein [Actinomycetota bacterium]